METPQLYHRPHGDRTWGLETAAAGRVSHNACDLLTCKLYLLVSQTAIKLFDLPTSPSSRCDSQFRCVKCLRPWNPGAWPQLALHGGVCGWRCVWGGACVGLSARKCLRGGACTGVPAQRCLH